MNRYNNEIEWYQRFIVSSDCKIPRIHRYEARFDNKKTSGRNENHVLIIRLRRNCFFFLGFKNRVFLIIFFVVSNSKNVAFSRVCPQKNRILASKPKKTIFWGKKLARQQQQKNALHIMSYAIAVFSLLLSNSSIFFVNNNIIIHLLRKITTNCL